MTLETKAVTKAPLYCSGGDILEKLWVHSLGFLCSILWFFVHLMLEDPHECLETDTWPPRPLLVECRTFVTFLLSFLGPVQHYMK